VNDQHVVCCTWVCMYVLAPSSVVIVGSWLSISDAGVWCMVYGVAGFAATARHSRPPSPFHPPFDSLDECTGAAMAWPRGILFGGSRLTQQ